MIKKLLCATSLLCAVTACDPVSHDQFASPGDPEGLLDVSSELVSVGLDSKRSLTELTSLINDDMPTRAELDCKLSDIRCAQAKEILANRNVPSDVVGDGERVVLVYERVVARDCSNVYGDNKNALQNLNYVSFGCSVKANTVQMVTDRQQFTNPALLDLPDAEKGVQVYEQYLQPPSSSEGASSIESLISDVGGGGGGSSGR